MTAFWRQIWSWWPTEFRWYSRRYRLITPVWSPQPADRGVGNFPWHIKIMHFLYKNTRSPPYKNRPPAPLPRPVTALPSKCRPSRPSVQKLWKALIVKGKSLDGKKTAAVNRCPKPECLRSQWFSAILSWSLYIGCILDPRRAAFGIYSIEPNSLKYKHKQSWINFFAFFWSFFAQPLDKRK